MKLSVLLVTVTVAVLVEIGWWGQGQGCGSSPLLQHDKGSARIIGGKPVKSCEVIPWQVGVSDGQGCGGSIISDRHILTAAHCLDSPIKFVTINLADLDKTKKDYSEETRNIKNYTIHPDYDDQNGEGDIAVVTLKDPIPSDNVCMEPICLDEDRMSLNGRECIVSGWGVKDKEWNFAQVLHMVKVMAYRGDECPHYVGDRPRMICAGHPRGNRSSCDGDSGGPLVCWDGAKFVQVGIVSHRWNIECGLVDAPGILTDVNSFLPWVKQIMRENP